MSVAPLPNRPSSSRPVVARTLSQWVEKTRSAGGLCTRYVHEIPQLGMTASSVVFLAEASSRHPLSDLVRPFAPSQMTIKPAGYRHRLTFRRTGTDVAVIRQLLVREEYRPVSALSGVKLVVDCGANIGASAYYFLHRYPSARLVAVEPDIQNVRLCRRNLAAFGDRAIVLRAAVWPERRPLRIVPASRALGFWALRVEPVAAGAAEVEGLTIAELLERAGVRPPIDLLKMDIEGAETDVFEGRCRDWLDLTRHLAIELHGPAARQAFDSALSEFSYERQESHELTVAFNLRRLRAGDPVSAPRVSPETD